MSAGARHSPVSDAVPCAGMLMFQRTDGERLRVVLHAARTRRNEVEHRLRGDRSRRVVVKMEVRVDDRVRLETYRHAGREADPLRRRRHHAEQVCVADEGVLRAKADAARRILDAGPEVGARLILAEVLPQHEVVRPGRDVQLEAGDVHRPAVRRDRVLAALAVGAGLDDERRHPHLESVPRLVQVEAPGLGGGREGKAREGDEPGGAHQRRTIPHQVTASRKIDREPDSATAAPHWVIHARRSSATRSATGVPDTSITASWIAPVNAKGDS